jgi:glycosyltransferase involved in cell wall biosynthesis
MTAKNTTRRIKKMRVLLTDVMFPNKYAKWRLVEIKAFIQQYNCDILVLDRTKDYNGISYEFDYEELKDEFSLGDYDILIFNPKYNWLDKYNTRINGIEYNNMFKSDYMLRYKRNGDFNYNIVYHIFYMNYIAFNNSFIFPLERQYIHLYPGGGYFGKHSIHNLNKDVNIIATQEFISRNIVNNRILSNYGGPFFDKNEQIRKHTFTKNKFIVCFTSLGNSLEKGADVYVDIAKEFNIKYPELNVKFIAIGVCPKSKFIDEYKKPMDQTSLSNYYNKHVDVLINLDSGKQLNGFPLGIEAASQGTILLTTDVHRQNILNKFNFNSFFIINRNNLDEIIKKLKLLHDNIEVRKSYSQLLQEKVYELFSYENTMEKIFKFISNTSKNSPLVPL